MKLHQNRIDNILRYISLGMTIENACYVCGICRKTYYLWYNQGKKDSESEIVSLQQMLYDEMPRAMALCELTHLRNIFKACKTDWKASAWYLEHTRPERYARRKPIRREREDENYDGLRIIG
ncbi:MAG: hypothetical protein WCI23_09980 [Chlorobiaceae bacterium]|jgi:hypothetical protein